MPRAPSSWQPAGVEPWRGRVLDGLLRVSTLVMAPLVAVSLLLRAAPPRWLDLVTQVASALILPALYLARQLSVSVRAAAMIATLSTTSIFFLARTGFVAGVSVALVLSAVLGVVFFGRRAGLAIIAALAASVVAVGVLAGRGVLPLVPLDVDPLVLRNWLRMAGTTTLLAVLLATVIDFVIRQVEAGAGITAQTLASLRLAYEHLGRLHRALDVAKEEERGFLARELHDELGQALTALKLRLQLEHLDAHRETIVLIDQLISKVRRLSTALRPPLLDEAGLVPALRAHAESESKRSGVAIDFAVDGPAPPERLPSDLEIASFRAVQEAVDNAIRHAEARHIHLRLAVAAGRLALSIRDDGRGFGDGTGAAAAANDSRGGLLAARERIRTRGGSFEVISSSGAGTEVRLELPIDDSPVASAEWQLAAALDVRANETAAAAWRDDVRDRVVTAAAVVAPALAGLALFIAPAQRQPMDIGLLLVSGLLLPIVRLVKRLSVSVRAQASIWVLFAAGLYVLARAGFGTGVSVLLATTCAVGVVCFGARFGASLIGIAGLAYIGVGLLVTGGVLLLDPAEVDPLQLQNWVRLATTTALLSALLVLVLDYVIRHVEGHVRATREALAELGRAYERLGSLHGSVEAAKEEERRLLAHELQGELGQTLTALKLRLRLADPPSGETAATPATALIDPESLVDEVIERMRRMSVSLRPPLLDELGLAAALRSYLRAQSTLSGVEIDVATEGALREARLSPEVEIACFRIVQESVTNAIRHARARQLQVRLTHEPGQATIVVRDDGRGFDTRALVEAAAGGHLGVVGMRGRVRMLGGVFHLRSEPGSGTIVEVRLPVSAIQA